VFTTEVVIVAQVRLRDARVYLDTGWFKGMTFNGVAPQPSSESARGDWTVWDYGDLPAATQLRLWISWQTNPTNIGRHAQDVALYDGGTQLMTAHRMITTA
jgi:hypothetical protein